MGRLTARVVAVVQARMSSTRLPGKALAPLAGTTAIELLFRRAALATEPAELVLATSVGASDDDLAAAVERLGFTVVRGPLEDVLGRFVAAAEATGADAVVRLTGDCPLLDPAVVDHAVRVWRDGDADHVSTALPPRTFPDGMDVEVLGRATLEAAAAEATEAMDREHVTTYVWMQPERFRLERVDLEPALGELRVTLDTADDLEVLRALVEEHGADLTLADLAGGPVRMIP